MWARIEDSEVKEIIDSDPAGKYYPSMVWVECDNNTKQRDTFDGKKFKKYVKPEDSKQVKDKRKKITGVEFDGVMCSATNEDIVLLKSLESYILDGYELTFPFKNGNSLVINPENYTAFKAVYDPFVLSFFLA